MPAIAAYLRMRYPIRPAADPDRKDMAHFLSSGEAVPVVAVW